VDQVLVTGGTGFVARWCIVQLLERGYRVRTTVRDLGKEQTTRKAVGAVIDADDRLSFFAADLLAEDGWREAVEGCRFVVHPASPLGGTPDDTLIATARDGTLRVLRAAVDADIDRVVVTSAANTASFTDYRQPGVTDETLWTDPDAPGIGGYRRSKTLAEQAAWAFIDTSAGTTELTTILPGAIFGPILAADNRSAVDTIARMLRGEMPQVPRMGLEVVDVRDVASAHVLAMTVAAAGGERFLATGEVLWLPDIARLLRERLGAGAARVATDVFEDDEALVELVPGIGRRNIHTTAKAHRVLGWTPRPAVDAVLDCARSLIAFGAT
jgi:nucleoside-diphosphate-sugar epimerase